MAYYVVDPSRSSAVPSVVLAGVEDGVISCDRHSAYKKFSRLHPGIVLSFCWAHQRRDFLTLANEHPTLATWAMPWVDRIGELFDRYEERAAAAFNSAEYRERNTQLCNVLRGMARERNRCLKDPQLPAPAGKILQSMQRHWEGLREFVHHREVPPGQQCGRAGAALGGRGTQELLRFGQRVVRTAGGDDVQCAHDGQALANQPAHLAARVFDRLRGGGQSCPGGSESVFTVDHGPLTSVTAACRLCLTATP